MVWLNKVQDASDEQKTNRMYQDCLVKTKDHYKKMEDRSRKRQKAEDLKTRHV